MSNAFAYVRVSTDRQETDRQLSMVRAWATAGGHQLLKIIAEPAGVSGRSAASKAGPGSALAYYSALASENFGVLERSGYASLLRELIAANAAHALDDAAPADVPLVAMYAVDRFSRDTIELLLLDRILAKYGASLVCVGEGGTIDTSTAAGKFMWRILCAKAELECDQTSERTGSTLRRMVARGDKVGRPPIGWRPVRNGSGDTISWEHDPATWPKVERVYQLRAQGMIYRSIEIETGVSSSRVHAYLDAYSWRPPGQDDPQRALQLDGTSTPYSPAGDPAVGPAAKETDTHA